MHAFAWKFNKFDSKIAQIEAWRLSATLHEYASIGQKLFINNILVSFMVLRVHLCYAVGESSIGRKAEKFGLFGLFVFVFFYRPLGRPSLVPMFLRIHTLSAVRPTNSLNSRN